MPLLRYRQASSGLTDQSFPRQARILKTDEFSSVFSFRKRIFGPFLSVHYQPNSYGRARLGIVVAKKLVRLSVERNYIKRVIRTWFRQDQTLLNASLSQGIDLVVRANRRFGRKEYAQAHTEWQSVMRKLQSRIPRNEKTSLDNAVQPPNIA